MFGWQFLLCSLRYFSLLKLARQALHSNSQFSFSPPLAGLPLVSPMLALLSTMLFTIIMGLPIPLAVFNAPMFKPNGDRRCILKSSFLKKCKIFCYLFFVFDCCVTCFHFHFLNNPRSCDFMQNTVNKNMSAKIVLVITLPSTAPHPVSFFLLQFFHSAQRHSVSRVTQDRNYSINATETSSHNGYSSRN